MTRRGLLPSLLLLLVVCRAEAQDSGVLDRSESAMRPMIERWVTDRASLTRRHAVPMSPARRAKLRAFFEGWQARVSAVEIDELGVDGRVDRVLFRNKLRNELARLQQDAAKDAEIHGLVPYWKTIVDLAEARWAVEPVDPRGAAATVAQLAKDVDAARRAVEAGPAGIILMNRARSRVRDLRRTLDGWFSFRAGYDPMFTWWVKKPYERAAEALREHGEAIGRAVRKASAGDTTLIGDPIGNEALLAELAFEMIPYSPAELIEIAKKEFAWCDAEMAKASKALGFEDWRKAQDHVKGLHVPPGDQPKLIKELAEEAVRFLDERDLVTVPQLCRETWRMTMLSPARQKVSPYFLGGERIQVSYPTDTMDHADKLMSMRGNNPHFSRATVHHELIPGHHLQGYMRSRYRAYRRPFSTPFWIEGWALYWEMLLWDLDFPRGPEDRIGMLFWRKHRCARIIFSLSFHLKTMTAPECVDFLVERVGHERNNAEAEVRRSVGGSYGPLYQAAYMLGGLQIRALRRELVDTGKMTDRAFHDAILHQNSIPIEMTRVALKGEKIGKSFESRWRFYE